MTEKVLYEELVPQEFSAAVKSCPVAYLPLGTLEWHGEHLPLGADGIQSQGFFIHLAKKVGGVVLPMLFVGPDGKEKTDDGYLYGMDKWTGEDSSPGKKVREPGQLPGSAYWIPDELFVNLIDSILGQLKRAGFKIVVAHGHGPSGSMVSHYKERWYETHGLIVLNCWGEYDNKGFGVQCDHAAANETSLVMALRPDLVQTDRLPADLNEWPVAVGGQDPRIYASTETGEKIIEYNLERMSNLLNELKKNIRK